MYDDPVPKQTVSARGIEPISGRWVDVNGEGENKYNVRCRLVGKGVESQASICCCFLVTDGVSEADERLEIGMFDISRAHFMPKADR